jgi:Flp pilus assembly CpaE family ATPase
MTGTSYLFVWKKLRQQTNKQTNRRTDRQTEKQTNIDPLYAMVAQLRLVKKANKTKKERLKVGIKEEEQML